MASETSYKLINSTLLDDLNERDFTAMMSLINQLYKIKAVVHDAAKKWALQPKTSVTVASKTIMLHIVSSCP